MGDGDQPGGEQQRTGERRRYQRRRTEDVTPPYYEAFERMATALEGIQRELTTRLEISLPPDVGSRPAVPRSPAQRR
jgi:hypothetical protein